MILVKITNFPLLSKQSSKLTGNCKAITCDVSYNYICLAAKANITCYGPVLALDKILLLSYFLYLLKADDFSHDDYFSCSATFIISFRTCYSCRRKKPLCGAFILFATSKPRVSQSPWESIYARQMEIIATHAF